ncbi:hypothetical protein V2J09_004463 [Rumex salicifolius]
MGSGMVKQSLKIRAKLGDRKIVVLLQRFAERVFKLVEIDEDKLATVDVSVDFIRGLSKSMGMDYIMKDLFEKNSTKLRMIIAYHPETDWQSEVLNRCLKTYLHREKTHFEGVYGRPPPTLQQYLPGEFVVASANKKRRELEFKEGDLVFLKLRPHGQSSLLTKINQKLVAKYFGPIQVLMRIGVVAYEFKLPGESKIRPVFHVSLEAGGGAAQGHNGATIRLDDGGRELPSERDIRGA